MAASTVVPARRRPHIRVGAAAAAAARTAPRGAGLAPVVALPLRGSAVPADLPARAPAAAPRPQLVVVPPPARRDVGARRRLVVILAAAVLLALGVATIVGGASDRGEPVAAGHVVLQPGETLWDVAVRSAPTGVDPRRQLDALRRLNGFGPGPLDAWTVVLIPAV